MAKFNVLMERSVFTFVPVYAAKGMRIYSYRLVHHLKHEGKSHAFEKSCLVMQASNDTDQCLHTHAPTVYRVSQRLLLALCDMDRSFRLFTRKVTQAYF